MVNLLQNFGTTLIETQCIPEHIISDCEMCFCSNCTECTVQWRVYCTMKCLYDVVMLSCWWWC